VALALLPLKISSEREELRQTRDSIISVKVEALKPLDLSTAENALKRIQSGARLDFSGAHNLLNPVPWQKAPNGTLARIQPGKEMALPTITKLTPLYLSVSYEGVGAAGSNYLVKVNRETETNPKKASTSKYLKPGEKIDVFTLREVKGPAENPTALIFDATDTGETATVTAEQPFRRVDGYMTDLHFAPEKRSWSNLRVGGRLSFGGDDYNVAAINAIATNQFEVVLSAKSTGKKTTITSSAPER
jgi:hypothetical protein